MDARAERKKKRKQRAGMKRVAWLIGACIAVGFLFLFNLPRTLQTWFHTMQSQPPNLQTAKEYYDAGCINGNKGWVELTRACMKRAIELDTNGTYGKKARVYIETQLPIHPVPADAEERGIEAWNLDQNDQRPRAEQMWQDLIRDYPNFEWPYTNLASDYLADERWSDCEAVLVKVMRMNPNLATPKLVLADRFLGAGQFEEAMGCVESVLAKDPENYEALAEKQLILKTQKESR